MRRRRSGGGGGGCDLQQVQADNGGGHDVLRVGVGDIDARAGAMLQLAGSPTAIKVRGGEGKRRGE